VEIRRKISRRSFLGRVAGGAAVVGGAFELMTGPAVAQVTDSDTGSNADPAGRGRGRTGVTDRDPGDAVGNGRGGRSGVTDNDTGSNADPAGNGRGRRACSDSDSGTNADPVGRGRRC